MIVFAVHAMEKLATELGKLGLNEQLVMEILRSPDSLLYDVLTGRFVAVGWAHNAAVVYEKRNGDLLVVTIIYSTKLTDLVNRRKRAGKWI